jgi:hypothetical protein
MGCTRVVAGALRTLSHRLDAVTRPGDGAILPSRSTGTLFRIAHSQKEINDWFTNCSAIRFKLSKTGAPKSNPPAVSYTDGRRAFSGFAAVGGPELRKVGAGPFFLGSSEQRKERGRQLTRPLRHLNAEKRPFGPMHAGKNDKSIVEKAVEAVKEFAATVSDAADKAMAPERPKPGDEVVMMPMAAAGFTGETAVPPFVVVRKQRKAPRKFGEEAAKKTTRKSAKKTKKTAKTAAKKVKSPAGRKAAGTNAKKSAKKKKTKKSRR